MRLQWPAKTSQLSELSVNDMKAETRRLGITSFGEHEWPLALPVHQPIEAAIFFFMMARRLRVGLFVEEARCPSCHGEMEACGNHAAAFCSFGPVTSTHSHVQVKRALTNGVLKVANLPVQY